MQWTVNLLLNGTEGLERNDCFIIIPPFTVIVTVATASSCREQHCFKLCFCVYSSTTILTSLMFGPYFFRQFQGLTIIKLSSLVAKKKINFRAKSLTNINVFQNILNAVSDT